MQTSVPATPPPTPAPATPPPPPAPGSLAELLKAPDRFAAGLAAPGSGARILRSLAIAAAGFALYGFAAGFFSGSWTVALLSAAKGAAVALFAFALCLPSLYVFACVAGTTLGAAPLVALGAACAATGGMLLAALAPVLWLFAVSSEHPGFLTPLAFLLALGAVYFSVRPALGARAAGTLHATLGLRAWLFVFVLVALQTVTLLRPFLSAPPAPAADEDRPAAAAAATAPAATTATAPAPARQKLFFLEHFFRVLENRSVD